MSLLNLPSEATLALFQKMDLLSRTNLTMTHTRLASLSFDRLLQRNSTKTLTLNELCQLYDQSRNENEIGQLLKSNVLDRLLIKNVNEVVHLYMDPKYERLVASDKILDKILHSLNGRFILEGEEEKFRPSFVSQFLSLLERAEGTLLLAFVNVKRFGAIHAKRCAQILSNKLTRGQKVYCIEHLKTSWGSLNSCGVQIYECLEQVYKFNNSNFTIFYQSSQFPTLLFPTTRGHNVFIDQRDSVANTKVENTTELINLITGDSLIEEKQHLVNVLALVENSGSPGRQRNILCGKCSAHQNLNDAGLLLVIIDQFWYNCGDGCELK